MKHSFSFNFWLRRDVRSDKNEGYISARITLNGKRAEIATGFKIDADRWNVAAGGAKGNKEDARTINVQLTAIKNRINEIYLELRKHQPGLLTAELIRNTYFGKTGKQRTLMELFDYHNTHMQAQIGKDYALGTYKRFETCQKLVQAFMLHQYGKSDMHLSELNHEFVTNLEFYFKTVRSCAHNTTIKYITNLRKIIHLALINEWLDKDPFVKFKCTIKETKRDHLTEEELHLLREKTFPTNRLSQVRDIFLFCCYTGLAYADVEKLSPNQIGRGVDGKHWIFTDRTKTKTTSNIPLLSPALAIFKKYHDDPEAVNKGRIFPVTSNQKMNAYLKEIADLCGIAKTLTTHVARHTFATTVTLTNGVPLETVSSMLGHKNIKTTQIYAKVVQKKISHDMDKLEQQISTKTQADLKESAG